MELLIAVLTVGVCYVMGHIEEIYFWLHEPEQPKDTRLDVRQMFLDRNNVGEEEYKRKYNRGEYFIKEDKEEEEEEK